MDNIDLIEAASGGPFVVRCTPPGYPPRLHVMPSPVDMSFQRVLARLQAEHLPETPRCPEWQRELVFRRWAAHYDLPEFQSAQRLAYLLDRYRSALVYDVAHFANDDIGHLWRARRWRTALDIIDHLPGHSWYSTAVSGDEEHAAMIAESLAARQAEGEQTTSGPSLNTWTPEVAAITQLDDSVRQLIYVTTVAAGDKTAKPPAPLPRPHTPLESAMKRADFAARKAKHQSIVERVLPHKRRA